MLYKKNWSETKERFTAWWGHKGTGRLLINLWAYRTEALKLPDEQHFNNDSERYLDIKKIFGQKAERFFTFVGLGGYQPDVTIEKADKFVRKFGAGGFYFRFAVMPRSDAEALFIKADREWEYLLIDRTF